MERAQRLIEEGSSDADMEDVGDLPITPPRNSLMRRGEQGMIGATNQQRRDVRSQEIRSRQKEQRTQNRYQAKLEKQANSQKHFRVRFRTLNAVDNYLLTNYRTLYCNDRLVPGLVVLCDFTNRRLVIF